MMSSHLALPRLGHLKEALHIFAYLKSHQNAELVFNSSLPNIDYHEFEEQDWTTSEFGNLQGKEQIPPAMPQLRGVGFTAKVDADHAANTVTRQSRMGFLVYLNCALVYWHAKNKNQ